MALNPSLAPMLDASAEKMTAKALAAASPSVFEGLSDKKAELLKEALGIETIADLATNKFVLWAQAIHTIAKYEK